MTKLLTLSIAFTFSFCAHAQETIRSTEFIKNIANTVTVASKSGTVAQFKSPLFEEFSIRTETRDFDFDRQEYQFRFDLSNRAKRKAQNALFDIYNEKFSAATSISHEASLTQAYKDWLDLHFIYQEEEALRNMKLILQDKLFITEQKNVALDLELKNLLNFKRVLNDLEIELLELELARKTIFERNNLENTTPIFDDLISIQSIIELLYLKNIQIEAAYEDDFNLKSEIINREIALEKAEQKEIFDFGQIRYRGPHEDLLNERISLAAAININNSGNQKLKIAELQLEKEQLEYEYQQKIQEENIEAETIYQSLLKKADILETYETLKKSEVEEANRLSSLLSKKEGLDPMILLDIKQNEISIELEKLKRQEDIYDTYLDYLIKTNAIWMSPNRNFLK